MIGMMMNLWMRTMDRVRQHGDDEEDRDDDLPVDEDRLSVR